MHNLPTGTIIKQPDNAQDESIGDLEYFAFPRGLGTPSFTCGCSILQFGKLSTISVSVLFSAFRRK